MKRNIFLEEKLFYWPAVCPILNEFPVLNRDQYNVLRSNVWSWKGLQTLGWILYCIGHFDPQTILLQEIKYFVEVWDKAWGIKMNNCQSWTKLFLNTFFGIHINALYWLNFFCIDRKFFVLIENFLSWTNIFCLDWKLSVLKENFSS